MFEKITAIDPCGLTGPYAKRIASLSRREPVFYDDLPQDEGQIIERIGDSDCVLVSWNTRIGASVLAVCPGVRYIGMCCSLYDEASANVDIAFARRQGIAVRGVRDYGDKGTVEFIFASLISLYKGLGAHRWSDEPTELTSKTLGIVGMGVLGRMVADTARMFGMRVVYFSRTPKPDIEAEYLDLESLLRESDIITTHLPRNTRLLDAAAFYMMKKDAVYVNTSLGEPFDPEALLEWLGKGTGNYGIFDSAGYSDLHDRLAALPNTILYPRSSGFTAEARGRLTRKVWENMQGWLTASASAVD